MWLAAALLVMAGLPVEADSLRQQDPTVTTLTGELTVLEPASDILLRVTPNTPVSIGLSSETFDATLTLYDAIGQIVAENDDHDPLFGLPARTDAALVYTPRGGDLLLVRAASLGWLGSGPYTLTVQGATVLSQNPFSIVETAPGPVIEGELVHFPGREPRVAYAFQARSDGNLTITLTSADFDVVLAIYDSSGAFLIGNDDHNPVYELPNQTDAALQFGVPEDGEYVALVRSYDPESEGHYTLNIEGAVFQTSAGGAVTPAPGGGTGLSAVLPGAVACAPLLGGVVASSSSFSTEYRADNLIDSSLETGWSSRGDDLAPYIIFEVSSAQPVSIGSVVFDGFSASPGFESDSIQAFSVGAAEALVPPDQFTTVLEATAPQVNRLEVYAIEPVEARYILLSLHGNYGGRYFQATEFNVCAAVEDGTGDLQGAAPPFVVTGLLPADVAYLEYRVYALEGADVTFTLTSQVFDPVIEVYAADGRRLGDNDDHPPEIALPALSDAGLRLTFAVAETLLVRVRSFALGGAFVLTIDGTGIQLEPPEAPPLPACRDVSSAAMGGSIVRFSSEFTGRWLAEYLIDGHNETGWASAPGTVAARREYVVIDLAGGEHTIQGFRINPSATGGDSSAHNTSRFAVLVSNTDLRLESFQEVFATLLTDRYTYTLAFDLDQPVEARYVMLETRDSFGGRWHEVAEFTVCAVAPR